MTKAILFDLDGTLMDNRVAVRECVRFALKNNNCPEIPETEMDKALDKPKKELFGRLFPNQDELVRKLSRDYRTHYSEICDLGVRLLDGVPETLRELRQSGIKLALVTGKSSETLTKLLEKTNLDKYFDVIRGGEEGIKDKPDPALLNLALQKLNIEPRDAIYVGDTPKDMEAARAAGVYSIAVLSGIGMSTTTREELAKSRPDATLNSVKELPSFLAKKDKIRV